ncbi:MAG: hypothetical protein MUO31_03795 [Thermodesulfovibrionales bacterium]|nr:hypothetical protein [Thermodesulfovibrionales bacterium]
MAWIVDLWEFIATTKFAVSSLSIIFFLFILLNILFRLSNKEFTRKVIKQLNVLKYLFAFYVAFSLIIIGVIKDDILWPFGFILYTQLCGATILWCLFIFSTILRFSGLKTVLLGIPIGFFGILASGISIVVLPQIVFHETYFFGSSRGGHAPIELYLAEVALIMGCSLFIGGRNLYKKIRGVK